MADYCITAARPKNATRHLKSEFNLWKAEKINGETLWSPQGWKRGTAIATLLGAGHRVLTAREEDDSISIGAPVEMELRISKNETEYKISDMPDS